MERKAGDLWKNVSRHVLLVLLQHFSPNIAICEEYAWPLRLRYWGVPNNTESNSILFSYFRALLAFVQQLTS
ncbi:uncharacterized protein BT62DRAFT_928132 [Guyanagaster necrorhizus]|uniref:Uncharacterized protein n=1 Tax=Guyanagaster necrorhizus TaxID=856835 RepID=A0A9P7W276_9AGAR|nr:uncharacterized protein BT62DRAFT_928132 [Guyanagaster necrorhizus MCA 3950]KAG7450848.1 hypothetical protein BT62DRAFT_928132 [Guyanagaster necrorhizus MCA 3950]